MSDIVLSIVIPVYNAQRYIKTCLDSIFSYKTERIEVIVINDGSSDNSLQILQDYQQMHPIIIIDQQNAGVSVARNRGIEMAQGQYLTFVDADDVIHESLLQTALEVSEAGQMKDILIFNYEDIDEEGTCIWKNDVVGAIKTKTDIDVSYILGHYFNTVWGKVYCTELIKKNKIYFPVGVSLGEDTFWVGNLLSKIKTYACFAINAYGYRQNDNGAVVQLRKNLSEDRILDYEKEILMKEQLARDLGWDEQQMGSFYQRFSNNIVAKVNFAIKGSNDKKELINTVNQFIKNGTIKHILVQAGKSKYVDWKRRIICRFIQNDFLRKIYLLIKSR